MAVNFKLPAIPFQDQLAGPGGMVAPIWNRYLTVLVQRVLATEWIVASTVQSAQGAAIAATDLGPALPEGLYAVKWYGRVTQAASSSSSLQVTVTWTDGGVAQSVSGASLTGNTTSTAESVSLPLFHADAGAQVKYAAAYSSSGATSMQFGLTVVLFSICDL